MKAGNSCTLVASKRLSMSLFSKVVGFICFFSLYQCSFARNLEFTTYSDVLSCSEREYFDQISLQCVPCGANQTSKEPWFSCSCEPGFMSRYDGNGVLKCEVCPQYHVTSSDKVSCVPCSNSSYYNVTTRECQPCLDDAILVDKSFDGTSFGSMECVTCADDAVARDGACLPCHLSIHGADGESCSCPAKHVEVGGVCVPQTALEKVPDEESSHEVKYDNGLKVLSSFFEANFRLAAVSCTFSKNSTACQLLSNLCVLLHYTFDDDNSACHFYREEFGDNFINLPDHVPWLYYTEGEANVYLSKIRLKTQYNFKSGDPDSKLNLTVAKYSAEGVLLDYGRLEDILTLCPLIDFHIDSAVTFGTTFQKSCLLNVDDIWDSSETVFFDVFLQYYDDNTQMIYAVPVLNRNYREDGSLVNQQSERKWQLVRRFFLIDNLSGKGNLSPKSRDHQQRARVVRYAQSIEIIIRLREGENHGLIYPPLIKLTYGEIKDELYGTEEKVETTMRVVYTMDYSKIQEDLSIAVGVMSAFATLWSLIATWSWSRRCGKYSIDIPTLIYLILQVCGNLANIFFIVMFFSCFYWTVFFKRQDVVHLFLLTQNQEKIVKQYMISACILKLFQVIHILYVQVTLDMFIIDWEQPRAKNSLPHPQMSANVNDDKSAKGEQQPISIWRTYFIANEWNELQTHRKVDLRCQLFVTLMFLKVFGFENIAMADPTTRFGYGNSEYIPPQSYVCRFAVSVAVYGIIAALQWMYRAAFYERCVENKLQQFVDLCSIANISIFILEHKMYGYYIHGRSVHGYADVDMHSFYEQLKREEEDLCGHRGLEPSSECQTFEVAITYKFREQYDHILQPVHSFMGIRKRGNHGRMPSSEMEQSFQAHEIMKRFFGMFLQHAVKELDYIVKDKLFLESILDLEFQEVDDRCLFFRDNSHSFDKVLFCGHEITFVVFELLLFTFVDLLSYDFVLSAVVTFIVSYFVKKIRYAGGRKNVVGKTLVDQRFLI